ncbi:hypothetical protein Y032_0036g3298 [Ancylostoma ceylanicum]|uniref:Uncharacterized protein n=1 Tax=Ancylostoma ceylanicum TaxID=53326 RepID=A0A016UME2_9BILA|nr:hypothetical protein Y032_0036g3298 [Ancylostoma ceylanicum]
MPTSLNGVNFFNPTDEDEEQQAGDSQTVESSKPIDPLESLKNCSLRHIRGADHEYDINFAWKNTSVVLLYAHCKNCTKPISPRTSTKICIGALSFMPITSILPISYRRALLSSTVLQNGTKRVLNSCSACQITPLCKVVLNFVNKVYLQHAYSNHTVTLQLTYSITVGCKMDDVFVLSM